MKFLVFCSLLAVSSAALLDYFSGSTTPSSYNRQYPTSTYSSLNYNNGYSSNTGYNSQYSSSSSSNLQRARDEMSRGDGEWVFIPRSSLNDMMSMTGYNGQNQYSSSNNYNRNQPYSSSTYSYGK